ncbi:MAG: hypothetical protein F4107_08630 [Gemmatimonadetes bacterium]|nr:hypothetical protein [Gemmatimonadota bacterium]MYD13959.1 hypothetical protein [Gemmatimonadota bacterium]MYI65982.1 hypothetical protein [Gemmatimonadota bacterium]
MARTATDIVSTEQLRRELFLPGPDAEPDAGVDTDLRLTDQIAAAADWLSQQLGVSLLDRTYWRLVSLRGVGELDAIRMRRSRFVQEVKQLGWWGQRDPDSSQPPRGLAGWTQDRSTRTGSVTVYPAADGWPVRDMARLAAEVTEGWDPDQPSAGTAARVIVLVAKDFYYGRKGEWGPLHAVTTLTNTLRDAEVVA